MINGGGGYDGIYAGSGGDRIDAGDGDDYVDMSFDGTDRVNLGAGDDLLYLDGTGDLAPVSGASFNGGSGDDLISFRAGDHDTSLAGGKIKLDGMLVAALKGFEGLNFYGGSGNDIAEGAKMDDTLSGGSGNDLLRGMGGNDQIDASYGSDRAYGGAGDDQISGGYGSDLLDGGEGNDELRISVDDEADQIDGGGGQDLLSFYSSFYGNVEMSGNLATSATISEDGALIATIQGIERLSIYTGAGDDILLGGTGDDNIRASTGSDRVNSGAGNDYVSLTAESAGLDKINLGGGTDTLAVSAPLSAGGVDYTVRANAVLKVDGVVRSKVASAEVISFSLGGGDDHVTGGKGSDYISGWTGADVLIGKGGDDRFALRGDLDFDRVDGGNGRDNLSYTALTDTAVTGQFKGGVYQIKYGATKVVEATAVETITITGSSGDDLLKGGGDWDQFYGGAGNDTLYGGGDFDMLYGGEGNDDLYGGAGADRFFFTTPDSVDTVHDFNGDKLHVTYYRFGFNSSSDEIVLISSHNPKTPVSADGPVFLYDTDTGALSIDMDGAGGDDAVHFLNVLNDGVAAVITTDDILLS